MARPLDFSHDREVARAAHAAHARLMRGDLATLYVYFKPYRIEAFEEDATPTRDGWTLAWPERVPGNLSADQLVGWFGVRAARLPYLIDG